MNFLKKFCFCFLLIVTISCSDDPCDNPGVSEVTLSGVKFIIINRESEIADTSRTLQCYVTAGKKVVIFSGRHGQKNGNIGTDDSSLYELDVQISSWFTTRKVTTATVKNVQTTGKSNSQIVDLIKENKDGTDVIILSWCWSSQFYDTHVKNSGFLLEELDNMFNLL